MFQQAAVMDLVDCDKARYLPVPVWETYTLLLGRAGCQVKQPVWLIINEIPKFSQHNCVPLLFDPSCIFFLFVCRLLLRRWKGLVSMNEPRKPTLS